jgi:hypothetical protein
MHEVVPFLSMLLSTLLALLLLLVVFAFTRPGQWLLSRFWASAAERMQANATLNAGLKHAIDTEVLRLRHGIARRRLSHFDQLVGEILQGTRGRDLDDVMKWFGSNNFRETALQLAACAELIGSPHEREEMIPLIAAFQQNAFEVRRLAARFRSAPPSDRHNEFREMATAHIGLRTSLKYLQGAADWAAERRLTALQVSKAPADLARHDEDIRKFLEDELLSAYMREYPPVHDIGQ